MNKNSTFSKKLWKLGIRDFNTQFFDYNKEGDLIVKEGNNIYNIRYLAEKFGTGLEIMFPFVLEERIEDFLDLTASLIKKLKYQGKFFYYYPMKVNQNKEVVLSLIGEGANIETSSYNELYLVKKMLEQETFNPKIRILCNGPKTDQYMRLIDELQHQGLKVVPIVEGPSELKFLQYSRYDVGIRLDMPVKADSRWNKTIDKFGFSADEILDLGSFKNLKILHYHIGSQINKSMDILEPVKYALDVFFKLKKKNPTLDTINIGGGMGIPYTREKDSSVEKVIKKIFELAKREANKKGMPHPNLICEWGRFMVAPAQINVYKIIDTKKIHHKGSKAKRWYVIDGSFINDLPDTWAIKQKWMVAPVNNKNDDKLARVWIAGSSCDSDDTYTGKEGIIKLPDYEINNGNKEPMYVVFFDTGAYQDPLASHHCMLSSPAKIIAENGHIVIARKRETPDDVGKQFGW
jgi:arginine decarboxylase